MPSLPARILCVDDDADTRVVMTRLLRLEGYEVIPSGTCEGALRSAAARPIDLLITDLILPDASGRELLRRLRQFWPAKAILVTGSDSGRDERQFDCVLIKPVEFARLQQVVSKLLLGRAPGCHDQSTAQASADRS